MTDETQFPGTLMVVGALAGLGKAVALDFALQGCSSIFLGSHQDNDIALKQIAADLQQDHPSTKCAYYASPASGATSSALMVQKCVEAFGSVDYVVNICHGLTERKSVLDVLPDEFNTSIENIMVPLFFDLQAELRQMKTQTKRLHSTISIVNVSSVLGLATTPLAVTESALQHGVVALTRSCALDYARQGIRLNCVCPGAREDLLQGKTSLSKQEETKTPTGTLCKIQDIVDAVMFLASSKSNGISGHALPVDGAWMLHHI